MKALTTPSGNFGPFASIEVLPDRYRCDATDLPFNVVGQGAIVDAASIVWPAPPLPTLTLEQVRQTAQEIILAKYPLWAQINYANGIYPTAAADVMRAAIAGVITESNRLEDAIAAGIQATPNWPTL